MRALYVSNVLIGIIGIFVALAFLNVESALDAWWALSSIFSGGMLGLFLLGYISKKARNVDAVLGVICGIIVVVWMSLSPKNRSKKKKTRSTACSQKRMQKTQNAET